MDQQLCTILSDFYYFTNYKRVTLSLEALSNNEIAQLAELEDSLISILAIQEELEGDVNQDKYNINDKDQDIDYNSRASSDEAIILDMEEGVAVALQKTSEEKKDQNFSFTIEAAQPSSKRKLQTLKIGKDD